MKKFSPGIALAFFIGGCAVCYLLSLLMALGNAGAGAGDGAGGTGGSISADKIVVPYAGYFISGLVAGLIPWRPLRLLLGIIGHISPFFVFATFKDIAGVGKPFLLLDFIIFVPYSFAWFKLLPPKQT